MAKLFGKRGVFYEMVGQEVSGLDGFYDHEFQEYGEFGIRIPENPGKVCDEIEAAHRRAGHDCGRQRSELGDSGQGVLRHPGRRDPQGPDPGQPGGQSRELTPFILIREVKEERAPEEAQA